MISALVTTPKKAKGPARHAPEVASADVIRQHRCRDRAKRAKLVAAGVELPAELLNLTPAKTGRPRLPDDVIILKEHADAHRKRIYLAAVAERSLLVEAEGAAALCLLAGSSEAETEAEHLAAKRQRKLHALERQLDARNASDGVVADGPAAIRLRTFGSACDADELVCMLGACDSEDVSGLSVPRRMNCCSGCACTHCLRKWLGKNNACVDVGYESGVQGVTHVRRGRKVKVPMPTHKCPFCRTPVQSVLRAFAN